MGFISEVGTKNAAAIAAAVVGTCGSVVMGVRGCKQNRDQNIHAFSRVCQGTPGSDEHKLMNANVSEAPVRRVCKSDDDIARYVTRFRNQE